MEPFVLTLLFILRILLWIMIFHIVMSWLIRFQVLNYHQPIVRQTYHGLERILEPIYRPIRSLLPPMQGLDFSPIIVFIGIYFLQQAIPAYLL